MKRIIPRLALIALTSTVFFSCSKEQLDQEAQSLEAEISIFEKEVQKNQLVGRWSLVSMVADVAIDLNKDGTADKKLLQETSCFDEMSFVFTDAGSVTAQQSKLSLNRPEK